MYRCPVRFLFRELNIAFHGCTFQAHVGATRLKCNRIKLELGSAWQDMRNWTIGSQGNMYRMQSRSIRPSEPTVLNSKNLSDLWSLGSFHEAAWEPLLSAACICGMIFAEHSLLWSVYVKWLYWLAWISGAVGAATVKVFTKLFQPFAIYEHQNILSPRPFSAGLTRYARFVGTSGLS